MYCLTIKLNGKVVCSAGCADASFIDASVSGSIFDASPATLRVAGMKELPDDRSAHVYWVQELALQAGDSLTITPEDLPSGSDPASIVPIDSPEYEAEQKEYEDFLQAHVWPQPLPTSKRPTVSLGLTHTSIGKIKAAIPVGQQHILCSVLWNNHRPRPARIFARSFSSEQTLEWLRGEIALGESLCVEICA